MKTEYPKIKRIAHPGEGVDLLDQVHDLGDSLGISIDAVENSRKKVMRAKRFIQELRERQVNSSELARQISHSLVEGEMDLDQAIRTCGDAAVLKEGSTLRIAVRRTEDVAVSSAFAEVSREIDGHAVLRKCQQVATAAVSEIRKLREVLDGVRDAEDATRAGTKAATAWVRYQELLGRWNEVHELVGLLRDQHWIKPLPIGWHGSKSPYGRGDLQKTDRQDARRTGRPILELLDPVCDRWMPEGPFTEEQAELYLREREVAAEVGPPARGVAP